MKADRLSALRDELAVAEFRLKLTQAAYIVAVNEGAGEFQTALLNRDLAHSALTVALNAVADEETIKDKVTA